MSREEALNYAKENFGYNEDSKICVEFCAIIPLRHKAMFLPEYGIDGSVRDNSDWAYIDMLEKIDTGEYGSVRYF